MMGFLAAQGSGHDSCLYRAACEYPEAGMEYAQAGHATLTGVEIFSRFVTMKMVTVIHTIQTLFVSFTGPPRTNNTKGCSQD